MQGQRVWSSMSRPHKGQADTRLHQHRPLRLLGNLAACSLGPAGVFLGRHTPRGGSWKSFSQEKNSP